jgi:outer membrane protein assembly factor BamB
MFRRVSPVASLHLLLGALLAQSPRGSAQEWTRFRGPNGSGLSAATSVPAEWTEKDFNWRVELPGPGHSQPVLWGERIFLTSAVDAGAERIVLCLRAKDGATEWTRKYRSSTFKKHERNSYASSSPAADEDRVYFVFSTSDAYTLGAVGHDGKDAWTRDLGPYVSQHGCGASPIVIEDLVVLGNEQDGSSFLVAVDRKTGETRWKTDRKTAEVAYGTPCVFQAKDGKRELIFSSHAHGLSSVDPATGALNWEAVVFDKRTVSSPVIAGGLIVGTCGSGGGGNFAVAVKPGGKGDVTSTHVAYKIQKSMPYVPTPIAKDDLLFLWADMGVVSCVEATTGKVLWQERVGGNYSGSPVCVGDRIYCMSEEGDVPVVAASREFKLIARNPLGEGSRSVPAVAGGRMYLRTYTHLVSVGGRP